MPLEAKKTISSEQGGRSSSLDFLHGGGEAGARMRGLDWGATPLGPAELWPQSLKTIVRVMLDSRYAMWMFWGADLTFFCNDAYLPTVGIKRDWVLGARSDKVWQEIWPDIAPRIEQAVSQGQATWDEALLLFLERSGFPEETYHTFSYSPLYDDDSHIAGMLCVVTEVTERVIGERRLRTLHDLAAHSGGVRSVQEACDALIGVIGGNSLDLPFSCVYTTGGSQTRVRLAASSGSLPERYRPVEFAIDDPAAGEPAAGGPAAPWPIAAAARGGGPYVFDLPAGADAVRSTLWPERIARAVAIPVRARGAASTIAWLIAGISPRRVFDDGYRSFLELVAGQFAVAITDAEALESERARAEALAEIDRAKTLFFSNVSHEFRTPLTLLLGPLEETLADPTMPAPAREHLRLAHRNALRLQKLVNSLLNFARIEAGRIEATFEPVDLPALTRDLAGSFRSAIERAGLQFEIDLAIDQPVHVDREMWEQIVLNLLSNALKFTFHGRILLRLSTDGKNAVLEVSDTGVGIPAKELPRLFERFHRIEGSRGRTHEGSGIGLALVQELVKLHGGTVGVRSTPDVGTTFRVVLPFGAAHLPGNRVVAGRDRSPADARAGRFLEEAMGWISGDGPAAPGPMPAPAGRPLVLLADDNADMRHYVRRLLESDHEVVAVGDGEAALQAARDRRPDLVLSDVMMPKLDGFQLLRALRADPQMAAVPIILLTARAGPEATVEGLDAGADDYLLKPFSARELLARVSGALALARLRRESAEKLRVSDERFRAVQETSPDGFMVLEAVRDAVGRVVDFRWTYVNATAAGLAGRDREALLGKRVLELFPGIRTAGLFDRFVQVLDLGAPWVGEVLYPQDGLHLFVRLAVARVGDGVAVSAVDLSARWRAEEALKEADRHKDEFLAMLAHELRNPLAPIGNAVEFLSRTVPAEPRTQAALDMARRQVLQLTRLVDDLLDVSRITQGRIELKRRALELPVVIAQALESVDALVRERNHRISVVDAGVQGLRVNADPARLMQCIVNVLSNAAKYTDPGGEIRIVTRVEGHRVIVAITDSGMGIAPELLPRVFDLFVQGDRTLDRSQGGLGVGLAVVQRLIEMHDGTVTARSAGPGKGSTFELAMPRMDASAAGDPVQSATEPVARRILVVDDNQDSADSLAMLLEIEGHEVTTAYTAQAALERAQSRKPQVILLDIGLPELDGYEVARRLRKLKEVEGVCLIALTGYGQVEDRQRAQSAGFNDHLIKPADLAKLRSAIDRHPWEPAG
jgi:signal transduction histidine kinase